MVGFAKQPLFIYSVTLLLVYWGGYLAGCWPLTQCYLTFILLDICIISSKDNGFVYLIKLSEVGVFIEGKCTNKGGLIIFTWYYVILIVTFILLKITCKPIMKEINFHVDFVLKKVASVL